MDQVVLGVDVGTGSARAAIFDLAGHRRGHAVHPIRLWQPRPGWAEQSTADIWAAVCACVRDALAMAGPVAPIGLGFDATCSLAVAGSDGQGVSVDPEGDPARDVIVWMDHRATAQAERINATGAEVLRYVGGRISPEMQTPKLLWLREQLPAAWERAALFLDLPDWLTWRATGDTARSLCTTVCKWTYLGHEARWDAAYFRRIGLGELAEEEFARIGTRILPLGTTLGAGLSAAAAGELGLPAGLPVSVAAIDAHAGGIGMIGASLDGAGLDAGTAQRRLALIGGTSSCHMAVSPEPRFVPGVWGPYLSAMLPGLWLAEGGQSATGALLDHIVRTHPAFPAVAADAGSESVFAALNARLQSLAGGPQPVATLTTGLHVFPDFHGNRSPRADPGLRGMISGLDLSATADDLALLYLATVQGIACGTRHIIESLNAQGWAIDTLLTCGGDARNQVFLQAHADATGCRVVLPAEPEAVLLGAAILGALAAGAYADMPTAMAAMTRMGREVLPAGPDLRDFYDRKYAVHLRLHDDQMAYRQLMREG
ncbi:D-ribulokinase [Rhodovastum atsumiense]|uniref:FGGY-family carbohydrate kinase n=1 Tax=Rhodovastum atsumiense TaxID=504468 RepID=A0A5M6IKD8_9PROT|nr:FGGY-family carbohydrate kinase [Rhodovastum atsumiense]KAA5608721.1 FGGY-family carbohydrate kinase [Rhodovastum atsumiense]CAH2604967.1 D-ribulokinase [Rhodovastum atsumiense]